ncbi:hypothetical protein AAFF_G00146340 [Aldrovandia affinis]|uniref:Uncharacterized protein n=1 Tax=Aldrovandia affinis TaxID=143900 RepID=A0AAD7RQ71_9TELE|nr:hypothetical protein AAFF_G00146340 [Aldrovandia affinis]
MTMDVRPQSSGAGVMQVTRRAAIASSPLMARLEAGCCEPDISGKPLSKKGRVQQSRVLPCGGCPQSHPNPLPPSPACPPREALFSFPSVGNEASCLGEPPTVISMGGGDCPGLSFHTTGSREGKEVGINRGRGQCAAPCCHRGAAAHRVSPDTGIDAA